MGLQDIVSEKYSLLYDAASNNLPAWKYSLGNLVACFLNILVNYLSMSRTLGKSNAELSSQNETPITPAGWAFSIWGIIFSLQIVGSVFGAIPFIKNDNLLRFRESSILTIGHNWQLGWLCQSLWQFLFLIQTPFGNFLCFLALLGAFVSFLIPAFKFQQGGYLDLVTRSPLNYASYALPTSINAAWLNVAMPLGFSIMLKSFGVEQTALTYVSALLLVGVVGSGTYITAINKDFAYSLALLWGIQGIRSKHVENKIISWTALGGQVVLVGAIAFQVYNQVQLYRNPSVYSRLQSMTEGEL